MLHRKQIVVLSNQNTRTSLPSNRDPLPPSPFRQEPQAIENSGDVGHRSELFLDQLTLLRFSLRCFHLVNCLCYL